MVKKSKKSKSKRIPLRQKYKVLRKVRQHHKKKAKEAKKLGLNKKRKVEKDPGIPNDWPFKEQELKALEARRARVIEEMEQKKAARKERSKKRKLGLLEDDDISKFGDLASAKEQKFEERSSNDDFGGTAKNRDNSDRAFYKELVKVIEESDVILEVLDARDPLGTRCVDMEKMVMKSGHDKRLVLLLNKIDLVPREAVEKWLKYLREELPAVAFKCSTQEQRSNLGWKSSSKRAKTSNLLQTSDCLGAETLIKLLKNYSRSHDIVSELGKEFNVDEVYSGESSFIGSLKSVNDFNPVEVPPSCPVNFDESMIEGDVETKTSARGDENPDHASDGEDQPMSSEEEDANKNNAKTATSRQNEKLYAVEGMLNTKMKRAEKKRKKKAAKVDAMDDDYDFKVDYIKKKGSTMDVEDESGNKDDDNQIIGEVPMSGVKFDDE
uniref:Guanine nucleotide-binding protein-like 3 N-terminal domain-containing protein n=1 Tax=Manihot esculenta TaxID=3983 RepID=A0A251JGC9_MANES